MSRLNPAVIAAIAALVLLGGYYKMVLSPKREEASNLKAQVEQAQTDLAASQQTLAQYTKAKETYRASYATVARLGKAVPEDDDVRSLMVQLDAAAKKTGVDFRSIDIGQGGAASAPETAATGAPTAPPPPGASVGAAGFLTMPFKFAFRGKFFQMSDFLSELERFVKVSNEKIDVTGRLLLLDSVKLTPDATGYPQIKAEIGATSYLLPPTQGLTAGATVAGPGTVVTTPPAAGSAASGAPAVSTTATITGAK